MFPNTFSLNWQKQICYWSLWSVVIKETVRKIRNRGGFYVKRCDKFSQIVLKFLGMINYVFSLILEQKLVL